MKIIEPSVEVVFHYPYMGQCDQQDFLELVGRTCYKSEEKIGPGTASKFIKMIKDRGHHAMLEHCFASVKFVCDRGVSHELVRHRIASFAQESSRFCNYAKDKFDNSIRVINPTNDCITTDKVKSEEVLSRRYSLFEQIEKHYMWEIEQGIKPQIARGVLPTALKTEIWISANLREWMHIFNLRCAPAAHPQMIQVMNMALDIFQNEVPELFVNITSINNKT